MSGLASQIVSRHPDGDCASLADLRNVSEPFFTVLCRLLAVESITLADVLDLDYVELLEIISQAAPQQQLSILDHTLR